MKFSPEPPTYIVNPLVEKKAMWFPENYQLVRSHRNPSYLNSLWIGVGLNLFNFPQRLIKELTAAVVGRSWLYFLLSLFVVPAGSVVIFWLGIQGRLMGVNINPEVAFDSLILDPEQAFAALNNGFTQLVIDARELESHTA